MRRTTTMTTVLAGLVLTATAVAAAPSYAADSASPAGGASTTAHAEGPKGDGAKKLCQRAPKLERRIDERIKRMEGTVGTRGSIKYLEQRIANAKKANHTAIAKFLGDRLDTRKKLLTDLKKQKPDLKGVATWCKANNNGKAGSASPKS
ncbi:hypothetical protein [Streptomyces sp. ISL-11]|uniref:hypothetical protein n=1 Tax=Streptomyces sp. ISL-11 TaxID=2819174 RepID=UPI001BE6EBD7|nr:hypothetical protein [Streptomyces sp. ISL-11]MBT2382464.1 hypothetical protein [Streptomyces sp. ISL-11]